MTFVISDKTNKSTPADADELLLDEGGGVYRALSWSDIKTVLGGIYSEQAITGVESLDDTDFPKTLTAADKDKLFIVDLSGSGAGAALTLPAEATAGDGWGVRIRLIGVDSGFKLNVNDDSGFPAQWEMSVPGQLIHPVTDGTSWFNAEPGAILADTWITSSTTHTYAKGAVYADIWITGSGAGGNGGNESSDISSSSGGAGETRIGRISGFGASDTVTIGAGGAGGAAGSVGSDGNASSWGSFFTANGGDTGGGGDGGAGGTGGSGGQGIPGGGGFARLDLENAPGMPGGNSYWGAAPAGGFHSTAGADGSLGSGGASGGESDQTGGDGGDGIARCIEYA